MKFISSSKPRNQTTSEFWKTEIYVHGSEVRTKRIITLGANPKSWTETCLRIEDLICGHRGGDVEDPLAPRDRRRQGVAIEHVGLEQEQALRCPVHPPEVVVLGIT